jgi:beta-phosphoglucomutase
MEIIKKYIIDNNIKAILFDLNGTIIDDVDVHIRAWFKIINDMGRPISMEEAKLEVYGRNEELIERIFPGKFSEEERMILGNVKEAQYRIDYLPYLKPIAGFIEFVRWCRSNGLKLAIGSAAIIPNIDFVLDNCHLTEYFETIVSGEDVSNSKPDPEVFIKCALNLNIDSKNCLVFEDVPKGVEASCNANMKSVVLLTTHFISDFNYLDKDIIAYIKDYT